MTIEIANRLCAYRKKMGLSQEELAEKLGVSRQAVSKWERAEASPDTDNLILLSQIYGVTLDELLNKNPDDREPVEEDTVTFDKGVHVESADGDKVHIDFSGVHVLSSDGEKVHVGWKGIQVENGHITDGDDDDDFEFTSDRPLWQRIMSAVSWPIICGILYLLCGFFDLFGGWGAAWVIFLTIPVFSSVVEAIYKRDASKFCYPVFITLVYLIPGLYLGLWHPTWVLFLTIPIFYSICKAFKK